MKSNLYIATILLLATLLSSCGLFNNIQENHSVVNENRDYILVNQTPFNSLQIYASRQNPDDCSSYFPVATLALKAKYPFHVNPGETVYIRYCAPEDVYCAGCRLIKLIGNSANESNAINLQ
jgi:hypothetical protein